MREIFLRHAALRRRRSLRHTMRRRRVHAMRRHAVADVQHDAAARPQHKMSDTRECIIIILSVHFRCPLPLSRYYVRAASIASPLEIFRRRHFRSLSPYAPRRRHYADAPDMMISDAMRDAMLRYFMPLFAVC